MGADAKVPLKMSLNQSDKETVGLRGSRIGGLFGVLTQGQSDATGRKTQQRV